MKKFYSTIVIIVFCFVFMGNTSAYSEKLSVYSTTFEDCDNIKTIIYHGNKSKWDENVDFDDKNLLARVELIFTE